MFTPFRLPLFIDVRRSSDAIIRDAPIAATPLIFAFADAATPLLVAGAMSFFSARFAIFHR